MEQTHLSVTDTVNLGGYYTSNKIVKTVYQLLQTHVDGLPNYTILDTSCGSGNFLNSPVPFKQYIGGDIDPTAINYLATKQYQLFHTNALQNVHRKNYHLSKTDKIIIVGNPPYNDTTSQIKRHIKAHSTPIDPELQSRDLGISFLLSYNKLAADYICVLHPLSYLIKTANFYALKSFKDNYKLIKGIIFSSAEFRDTSKTTSFPILIALYQKSSEGMGDNYIKNYQFSIINSTKKFCIGNFDYIENFISKYPNKKQADTGIYFYTLRDINALKRNKTYLPTAQANAIKVDAESLPYYCYVDTFKEYIRHTPYYFGNLSIPINHNNFYPLKNQFIINSLQKYPYLSKHLPHSKKLDKQKIDHYFMQLLGEHYVY